LEKPQDHFRLSGYFTALGDELESFGFSVEMSEKKKNINSPIESAFIKAGTRIHNAVCKVKLGIDTDPPEGAEYEVAYIDEPIPFSVRSYSGPSLLAGKLDAVLSRGWKRRVKGRDWYDFAFLVRKKVPVRLAHLEARLRQKNFYTPPRGLDQAELEEMLQKRIE